MKGSLVFVCLVLKAKSGAFNEDIEDEELYSLLLVTLAYWEVLVRRAPAAVSPGKESTGTL